jgi:UDP-N-acetylmuramyl tripeptide synthase
MEVIAARRADKPLAVVDYAHTPDALSKALARCASIAAGTLWCVFGCGGDRDPGKRPMMGAVADDLADRIIVTDDNPRSEEPRSHHQRHHGRHQIACGRGSFTIAARPSVRRSTKRRQRHGA